MICFRFTIIGVEPIDPKNFKDEQVARFQAEYDALAENHAAWEKYFASQSALNFKERLDLSMSESPSGMNPRWSP
jgi:hypothetical protein